MYRDNDIKLSELIILLLKPVYCMDHIYDDEDDDVVSNFYCTTKKCYCTACIFEKLRCNEKMHVVSSPVPSLQLQAAVKWHQTRCNWDLKWARHMCNMSKPLSTDILETEGGSIDSMAHRLSIKPGQRKCIHSMLNHVIYTFSFRRTFKNQ